MKKIQYTDARTHKTRTITVPDDLERWEPSDKECPKCKGRTEFLYRYEYDDLELIMAERCHPCGWRIDL